MKTLKRTLVVLAVTVSFASCIIVVPHRTWHRHHHFHNYYR